jgi:hypothetical protein
VVPEVVGTACPIAVAVSSRMGSVKMIPRGSKSSLHIVSLIDYTSWWILDISGRRRPAPRLCCCRCFHHPDVFRQFCAGLGGQVMEGAAADIQPSRLEMFEKHFSQSCTLV